MLCCDYCQLCNYVVETGVGSEPWLLVYSRRQNRAVFAFVCFLLKHTFVCVKCRFHLAKKKKAGHLHAFEISLSCENGHRCKKVAFLARANAWKMSSLYLLVSKHQREICIVTFTLQKT